MKTKVISTRDFSAIKKMAQIVNPLVSKKNNILKKVAALMEEIEGPDGLDVQIAGMEAGIKAKFLGLGTEQLVKKVVTPAVREDGTPVLDAKTGKQLTKTTYEPLACLVYNEADNNYTLTVAEEEDRLAQGSVILPMTERGSDFDADSEHVNVWAHEIGAAQTTVESDDNPFNL